MDQTLLDIMVAAVSEHGAEGECAEGLIQIVEPETGEIEVETSEGPTRYFLKPLPELFGEGHGVSSLDWRDERFMPLLLRIEESIVQQYAQDPSLTDGHVSLVLSRLILHPGCDPGEDDLCGRLQLDLRLLLSLNDYSRQEVRWALRKVEKSVRRHSRVDGTRGYLDFIYDQFGDLGVAGDPMT
ncbi:MAG: hypothetical protein AMS14_09005 [Planctomycetes bacterium DG_20]|nr:MAG: hypothetical protein AMS14_09005 [Planctomycetes bacterium DG_20]